MIRVWSAWPFKSRCVQYCRALMPYSTGLTSSNDQVHFIVKRAGGCCSRCRIGSLMTLLSSVTHHSE